MAFARVLKSTEILVLGLHLILLVPRATALVRYFEWALMNGVQGVMPPYTHAPCQQEILHFTPTL